MALKQHSTLALLLVVACASSWLIGAQAALDNEVTTWFVEAQRTAAALGVPNQLAARIYGAVGVAQWDALKASRNIRKYARGSTNDAAIVAYAAHRILSSWFPQRQTNFYDPLIARQFAALGLTKSVRATSEKVALAAADNVLKQRSTDRVGTWARFEPATPNVPESIGKYQWAPGQTTTQYPHLGWSKTYFSTPKQLATIYKKYKPHVIDTEAYKKDLEEVKELGSVNSTTRTPHDTNSPRFWAQGTGTSAIGGSYLNISYSVLPDNLTLWQSARFYAALGAAAWDASVACYYVKYTTLFWRPVTAIRYDHGVITPDPNWTPLLTTPVHPEYPSGHQCTVGAAVAVLRKQLGRDDVSFTLTSEGAPDLTRSYTSLTQAAQEGGNARLYAGVHYRKSNNDGNALGREVAGFVLKNLGWK